MTLIDQPALERWLDDNDLEPGRPLSIGPIAAGTSNAMFTLDRGDGSWVLRRPSAVALDRADEGMRREFQFLTALEGTPVPHPRPIACCDDHAVLGCTFYVMDRVDGVTVFPVPAALDDDANRRAIGLAMADALALLHQVEPDAAGIAHLGRPDGFHERQVSRWTGQLASYEGRTLDGIDEIAAWLDAHRPAAFTPTIMHGDYHMLNVLIAGEAPMRVTAILDWETATIGDPLLDLAGFGEVWETSMGDEWPSRRELTDRYVETRGLGELPDLRYYDVLYNFRLAVLLEGVYQRGLQDPNRDDGDFVDGRVQFNVRRALELVRSDAGEAS